jgi:hypothetical protein
LTPFLRNTREWGVMKKPEANIGAEKSGTAEEKVRQTA